MAQCHVCDKYSDQLSYYEFGKQRVCAGHASDGTPRCDACYKFKKAREEYLDLDDHGRKLCSDCSSIAVIDPKECMPLLHNVREWYKSLNLKMDKGIDIPFVLVDRDAMLKFTPADNSVHKSTIGTIWLSNSSLRTFLKITKYSKSEGKIELEKIQEVLKHDAGGKSSGDVVAMVVLFGRPDVDMGATLAHEMMHVWLRQRLKGCTAELKRSVEEGICEVMAYMWLEWFCSGGFDSSYKTSVQVQYTRDLKDYLAKRMECRDDKIYGQGFRDARKAVSKFGLKTTLDHIVKNRCLPLVQKQNCNIISSLFNFLCVRINRKEREN